LLRQTHSQFLKQNSHPCFWLLSCHPSDWNFFALLEEKMEIHVNNGIRTSLERFHNDHFLDFKRSVGALLCSCRSPRSVIKLESPLHPAWSHSQSPDLYDETLFTKFIRQDFQFSTLLIGSKPGRWSYFRSAEALICHSSRSWVKRSKSRSTLGQSLFFSRRYIFLTVLALGKHGAFLVSNYSLGSDIE
jgi:hypothetical protein